MPESVDAIVIGAGVVGLAIARALARAGHDTLVLERNATIGAETSSRNSEVIHAGLYYPPGSRKARLCVTGRDQLYRYCADRGVDHRRCGKLIVAVDAPQARALLHIAATARANGVTDVQVLDAAQARQLEPHVNCVAALYSPSTGIVDSMGLMNALRADFEQDGGSIAFRTPVAAGSLKGSQITVTTSGPEPIALGARIVVNAAGHGAQALAAAIEGVAPETIPALHLCKGSYFTLAGRAPFSHLVYPLPTADGLGVHATLDLAGRVRFGPDAEWIDRIDYAVDPRRADAFYAAIRRYWPGLPNGALSPAYAGVRPKIERPGGSATDFSIVRQADPRGCVLINLYGIESPGLTASLAIADEVLALTRPA